MRSSCFNKYDVAALRYEGIFVGNIELNFTFCDEPPLVHVWMPVRSIGTARQGMNHVHPVALIEQNFFRPVRLQTVTLDHVRKFGVDHIGRLPIFRD